VTVTRALLFVDPRAGLRRRLKVRPSMGDFAPSPDGRRVAYTDNGGVWLADARMRDRRLIIQSAGFPAWSPDGRRLAVLRGRRLLVSDRDGRGARTIARAARLTGPLAWSPDGRRIALIRRDDVGRDSPCSQAGRAVVARVRGGKLREGYRPPLRCGMVETLDWSPDGRRIVAAVNDATEADQPVDPRAAGIVGLVVTDRDGHDARRIRAEGTGPLWSPNGRMIVFTSARCPEIPVAQQSRFTCLRVMRSDGAGVRTIAKVRTELGNTPRASAWLAR